MMKLTRLSLLFAAGTVVGCSSDSGTAPNADNPPEPDTDHVTATIDGEPYVGSSHGAVYSEPEGEEHPSELLLFPADPITGSLLGWTPGDTGDYAYSAPDDDPLELLFFYYDSALKPYLAESGTFSIDTWEPHDPVTPTDPRMGTITGRFHGRFRAMDGSATVEVTDGQFRVTVTAAPSGS